MIINDDDHHHHDDDADDDDDDDDDGLAWLGMMQSLESNESSIAGQLGSTARVSQLTVTDGLDSTSPLNTFTFTIVSTSAVIYCCYFNVQLANLLEHGPLSTRILLIFWSEDYIIMTTTTDCLPKLTKTIGLNAYH